MKKRLLHRILHNCQEATLLIVKREEATLTLPERAKLHYHLFYCSLCRNFAHQSKQINIAMQRFRTALEREPPFSLSERTRLSMKARLKE